MPLRVNVSKNKDIDSFLANSISEKDLLVIQWVVGSVFCQAIDIFGTITNIINIICFAKQGFKDSITVSLLGLAISDLVCLATLIFSSLCVSPLFHSLELSFEPVDVQFLTSSWVHVIFTRITSWITALITLERCLCITMPLKIKTIFTPKRVAIIIVTLFISITICGSPMYLAYGLDWRYSPHRNRTLIGLVTFPDREKYESISFMLNNLCLPYSSFIVVIACTTTLVINLRSKTKWRQSSTSDGQALTTSNRDQRVTRMVVVISTLFILCFVPISLASIAMLFVPGLSLDGRYRNALLAAACFGFLLESLNSAMNIFIYYYMSTRYRVVFRELFCRH